LRLINTRSHVTGKPRLSINRIFLIAFFAILIISMGALAPFVSTVKAQNDAALAEQYTPVLHFTSGEKFYPTSVEYIISSSILKQRTSGTPTVINSAPTADSLNSGSDSANMFLDNKLTTLDEIAADYASNAGSSYPVYVNVVRSGSTTVLQYWLFYIYNNGPLNNHEGDIEVVEIFLDSNSNPQTALYSQHGAGQNAAWGDVEKVDSHPVVYIAQGSHANYFRSFQGKLGMESDVVGNDGKTIDPSELTVVMLDNQGWLNYQGRWGYWGTDDEVIRGMAGPYGPVFNQDGVRWANPESYLNTTFGVNGSYLTIAWLAASFLMIFLIYIAVRAAWKSWCIYRLHRKGGGLLVGAFFEGRGVIGLGLGLAAIIVTIIALAVPWYTVVSSSATGPLAQENGVTLMTIDGVHGVMVNMFMGIGNSDSTSGLVTLFSTQLPFAIIIAAGIILLALDVVGVKSGKSLGKKLWWGIIVSLLPLILVIFFISQLPALLPFASGFIPGQTMPSTVVNIVNTMAASPIGGTATTQFPIIGITTVNWGLALGAYLFIVAVVLRIVGGFILYTTPELKRKPDEPKVTSENFPPPPPPQA
jgi:hypothetical protein